MSTPLAAKRRKLNDATNTLTKPFVSPLRSGKPSSAPLKDNRDASNTAHVPYTPSTLAHTIKASSSPNTPAKTPAKATSLPSARSSTSTKRPLATPFSKRTDPAELAAQKAITQLEIQIKSVRNEIDTLEQAAKITNSNTDSELEELAQKWKLASQAAAEELFGSVKERVNRMGGVEAWRESEKSKFERANGLGDFKEEVVEDDDADCEFDSQGEELPEDEQDYRKKQKRRARLEAMEAADVEEQVEEEPSGTKQIWQEGGGDDDAFTLDMMLRSLNIDLRVIGYDKVEQRWVS